MKLVDDLSHRERELGIVCERRKCTCQAVYIVHIHPMGHCNVPQLDVHGDQIFILCPACTFSAGWRIAETFDELKGVKTRCKTCGLWVEKLHHVYAVEWLLVEHHAFTESLVGTA